MKARFINCIKAVFQIPFMLGLLIIACLELLLTKCLACLENPLSSPLADLEFDRLNAKRSRRTDSGISIEMTLELLNTLNSVNLNSDRKYFEDTDVGRWVVGHNPNRRLYAVLRPTRQENLLRIRNVLCAMKESELHFVLTNTEKILKQKRKCR